MDLLSIHSFNIIILSNYIKSFGLLAPAVAFGLFVIQAVLPVFPYIILAAAGGILFGFKMGFLLAWSGALVGACLAYWLCKFMGTDWVIKIVQSRFGYNLRRINPEMAFWSIIVARIVPIVPTPMINIAAALGGISFWVFFLSSAIGKIPSAVLYTGLGLCLFEIRDIKLTLGILSLIIITAMIGHYLAKRRMGFFD